MSKRAKKNKKRAKKAVKRPSERPATEAVTIGWALTVVMVLLCDIGFALTRFYLSTRREAATIELLSVLLLTGAVVIGMASLLMLPVVLKARRVPPPRGFVFFAITVAVAPLGVLAWVAAR